MKARRIDVEITGGAGFYTFYLLTAKARAWVMRNVDRRAWNGTDTSFHSDDRCYALHIAQAMVESGLAVQ